MRMDSGIGTTDKIAILCRTVIKFLRGSLRRIFLKKQAFHPRNKNTRGFAPALNFYRLCGLSFLFFTFIPNIHRVRYKHRVEL